MTKWMGFGVGSGLVIGLLVGCGGPSQGSSVKTPEERIAEEERLAYEAEQRERQRGDDDLVTEEEAPMKKAFDQHQAEMELKRATRSAESCPGVVTDEKHRGDATVAITFANDGSVRTATVSAPFDGTNLGECILRAYRAVIVPPYDGAEETVNWDLTLKDPPSEAGAQGKKAK